MYNYKITRLDCFGFFRLCFLVGIVFWGILGLGLGLLEFSTVGILGGMFSGLVLGLLSGCFGLISAAVFNALVPVTGGLSICIAPVNSKITAATALESGHRCIRKFQVNQSLQVKHTVYKQISKPL